MSFMPAFNSDDLAEVESIGFKFELPSLDKVPVDMRTKLEELLTSQRFVLVISEFGKLIQPAYEQVFTCAWPRVSAHSGGNLLASYARLVLILLMYPQMGEEASVSTMRIGISLRLV